MGFQDVQTQNHFIATCENEQLHKSGKIQGHGALLVVDVNQTVTHISANFSQFDIHGQPLSVASAAPDWIKELAHSASKGPYVVLRAGTKGSYFDVNVIPFNDSVYFEFYKHQDQFEVADLPTPPAEVNKPQLYRKHLLNWVQKVTGHQRVMYYQFAANGDGVVIEEVVTDKELGSYLDLRYPASDIPQIARNLYVQNGWRQIVDVDEPDQLVYGNYQSLDLTKVDLRSVSSVHKQYMANMGVNSSVSFAVVVAGQLSALITCHSLARRWVNLPTLEHIRLQIDRYLVVLQRDRSLRHAMYQSTCEVHFASRDSMSSEEPTIAALFGTLKREIGCDAIVVDRGSLYEYYGESVEESLLTALEKHMAKSGQPVFVTDSLLRDMDTELLSSFAGVAAVALDPSSGQQSPRAIYFLRKESQINITWAGNPNKPAELTTGEASYAPRRSFSKWVERRLGHSESWQEDTRHKLLYLRRMISHKGGLIPDIPPQK
ncbi:hypothetical protein [Halioxenophilus aromaticivorans]|uniref:Phytochrome chromophore attachment site domain-containing protein n=1 Tax=Halioxenophilus aromaticivorans TaxID=1306992 RepID=A0AAV3U167_9ALTE